MKETKKSLYKMFPDRKAVLNVLEQEEQERYRTMFSASSSRRILYPSSSDQAISEQTGASCESDDLAKERSRNFEQMKSNSHSMSSADLCSFCTKSKYLSQLL